MSNPKISEVNIYTSHNVTVVSDNGETETEYVRRCKDAWSEWMGESLENIYCCEWLEELFQEHQRNNTDCSLTL